MREKVLYVIHLTKCKFEIIELVCIIDFDQEIFIFHCHIKLFTVFITCFELYFHAAVFEYQLVDILREYLRTTSMTVHLKHVLSEMTHLITMYTFPNES